MGYTVTYLQMGYIGVVTHLLTFYNLLITNFPGHPSNTSHLLGKPENHRLNFMPWDGTNMIVPIRVFFVDTRSFTQQKTPGGPTFNMQQNQLKPIKTYNPKPLNTQEVNRHIFKNQLQHASLPWNGNPIITLPCLTFSRNGQEVH